MINRKIVIVLCILLLTLPLIGCITNDDAKPAAAPAGNTVDARITATEQGIAAVRAQLGNYATVATTDALSKQINEIKSTGASGDTYSKSQLYTRTEVTKAIEDAVTAAISSLKSGDQSWIRSVAGTTSTNAIPGTTTGQTPQFNYGSPATGYSTSPTGGIESLVNWQSGSNLPISSASTLYGQAIVYTQRLINHNTAIQYARPTIMLSISNQYQSYYLANTYFAGINVNMLTQQGVLYGVYTPPPSWINANTGDNTTHPERFISYPISIISASSPTANTNVANVNAVFTMPAIPYTFNVSPGLMILANSLQLTPSSGLATQQGELMISPGQAQDVTVTIQNICTSTPMNWVISAGCSSHQ